MIDAITGRSECAHLQTRTELMAPGHMHFARVVCVICGKQLYWKANPGNAELRRKNAMKLQALLGNSRLSDWERGYCQGLQHNPRLSHKQQALLDELAEKYLPERKISHEPSRETQRHPECALA